MKTVQFFVSYSHENAVWFEDGYLMPQLIKEVERKGGSVWYDRNRLHGGAAFRDEIKKAIGAAHAAILLVSRDFLISEFIMDLEVPLIKKRVNSDRAFRVICIRLEDIGNEPMPFEEKFLHLPDGRKTLVSAHQNEASWAEARVDIHDSVMAVLAELQCHLEQAEGPQESSEGDAPESQAENPEPDSPPRTGRGGKDGSGDSSTAAGETGPDTGAGRSADRDTSVRSLRKRLAFVVYAVILALAAGILVWYAKTGKAQPETASPQIESNEAETRPAPSAEEPDSPPPKTAEETLSAIAALSLSGKMAFVRDRDIHILDLGTGVTRRLTHDGRDDLSDPLWSGSPRLSPDGSALAFLYRKGETISLCIMDADGANRRTVLSAESLVSLNDISWAPDGRHIAFISNEAKGIRGWDVFTVDISGKDKKMVVEDARSPDWSPDGKTLCVAKFGWDETGKKRSSEIVVVAPDGTMVKNLGPHPGTPMGACSPQWSPTGTTIAYVVRDGMHSSIHSIDIDGQNRRELGLKGSSVTWSPDGTRLAFCGFRKEILIADANGANPTKLLANAFSPSWIDP